VAEHHGAEEAAARRRRRGQGREQARRADPGPALSEAPAYELGPEYREDATLRDGTAVRLRLIRPDDKDRLRAGFARLSPASRYLRFFAPKSELTDGELRYLTECDGVDHVAIGAILVDADRRETDGLGVARFIRAADDPTVAEAAIAVLDEVQRRGLGTLLFNRLVAAARERGIARFRCDVLAENAAMIDMIESFSPERTEKLDGGVMTIELALPAAPDPDTPATPDDPGHRESPMFRLFRLIAEGAAQWRNTLTGRRPPTE
jgi:GNAT superfamily N-acetyltransferase